MVDEVAAWDFEADVVVLGSGGAAMTAAIAAHDFGARDVVILEKTGMVGGTTAMSGGMLWIPGNHHQLAAGIAEDDEDVVAYLDSLAPGQLDPETLMAFMETGPEMVRSPASTWAPICPTCEALFEGLRRPGPLESRDDIILSSGSGRP